MYSACFVFSVAIPMACGSSQAKDQTHTTAATQDATAISLTAAPQGNLMCMYVYILTYIHTRIHMYTQTHISSFSDSFPL